jgi:stalled ribosome alternative rescue factor ArfA
MQCPHGAHEAGTKKGCAACELHLDLLRQAAEQRKKGKGK